MPRTRLEYNDGKSSKFWQVERKGSELHLRWGRIGTDGQSKVKKCASVDAARDEEKKLIKSKTTKGYGTASDAARTKKVTTKKTSAKKATTKKATAKKAPSQKPLAKAGAQKDIINFTDRGMEIDGELIKMPFQIAQLEKFFGPADLYDEVLWRQYGIEGLPYDGKTFTPAIIHADYWDGKRGEFQIRGVPLEKTDEKAEIEGSHRTYDVGGVHIGCHFTSPKHDQLESVWIFASAKSNRKRLQKQYAPAKVTGPIIEFSDFNFKLMVIEELMYVQEVLEPRFDAHDFAEAYEKREIDVDAEGYDPIPEIVDYFKRLPIPAKYAKKITSLTWEGGNNIYLQITPFWDGEDDYFDVKSFDDVEHFPNLKKLTVYGIDEKTQKKLATRGIEVDPT
jgi:predicted DNA-binding WGR domain protein